MLTQVLLLQMFRLIEVSLMAEGELSILFAILDGKHAIGICTHSAFTRHRNDHIRYRLSVVAHHLTSQVLRLKISRKCKSGTQQECALHISFGIFRNIAFHHYLFFRKQSILVVVFGWTQAPVVEYHRGVAIPSRTSDFYRDFHRRTIALYIWDFQLADNSSTIGIVVSCFLVG